MICTIHGCSLTVMICTMHGCSLTVNFYFFPGIFSILDLVSWKENWTRKGASSEAGHMVEWRTQNKNWGVGELT